MPPMRSRWQVRCCWCFQCSAREAAGRGCVCLHENVLVLSEGKARLEPRFESWARIHYKLVVESAQRVADRLLNGPELSVRTCRNWM